MDYTTLVYSDNEGFVRSCVSGHIPREGERVSFSVGKVNKSFTVTKIQYSHREISVGNTDTVTLDRVYVTLQP